MLPEERLKEFAYVLELARKIGDRLDEQGTSNRVSGLAGLCVFVSRAQGDELSHCEAEEILDLCWQLFSFAEKSESI